MTDPSCDICEARRHMGMVFQSFNLFGHLMVIENLMVPAQDLLGRGRQEAYEEGMRLLRMVGMADKALSYPDELSGGQQQRVAIARTLALDPDVILMDEPTSALDPTMVGEVRSVIRDLARAGKTMLIVTHEMDLARTVSNRVLFMDEGIVYEDGTPEQIFDHPLRERTRLFVRRLRVLELGIDGNDYDYPRMEADIDSFCQRNQVPGGMAYHLHLVFEELLRQVLLPALERPQVRIAITYAEQEAEVALAMRYGGRRRDVTQGADPLSMAIIRGMSSSIAYEADGEPLPNLITVHVRP